MYFLISLVVLLVYLVVVAKFVSTKDVFLRDKGDRAFCVMVGIIVALAWPFIIPLAAVAGIVLGLVKLLILLEVYFLND